MRMRLYPDPMLLKQVMLTTGAASEADGVAIALEMMEAMREKDRQREERTKIRMRGLDDDAVRDENRLEARRRKK